MRKKLTLAINKKVILMQIYTETRFDRSIMKPF